MRRRDLKMGLETNIKTAIRKNLSYLDNKGKEVFPSDPKKVIDNKGNKPGESGYKDTFDKKAEEKLDQLAKDLSIAIRDFIVAQTFSIKKMEASVITQPLPVATPTGPGTLLPTKLTVSVKAQKLGPASMNPVAGVESMASEIGIEEMDIRELV